VFDAVGQVTRIKNQLEKSPRFAFWETWHNLEKQWINQLKLIVVAFVRHDFFFPISQYLKRLCCVHEFADI